MALAIATTANRTAMATASPNKKTIKMESKKMELYNDKTIDFGAHSGCKHKGNPKYYLGDHEITPVYKHQDLTLYEQLAGAKFAEKKEYALDTDFPLISGKTKFEKIWEIIGYVKPTSEVILQNRETMMVVVVLRGATKNANIRGCFCTQKKIDSQNVTIREYCQQMGITLDEYKMLDMDFLQNEGYLDDGTECQTLDEYVRARTKCIPKRGDMYDEFDAPSKND